MLFFVKHFYSIFDYFLLFSVTGEVTFPSSHYFWWRYHRVSRLARVHRAGGRGSVSPPRTSTVCRRPECRVKEMDGKFESKHLLTRTPLCHPSLQASHSLRRHKLCCSQHWAFSEVRVEGPLQAEAPWQEVRPRGGHLKCHHDVEAIMMYITWQPPCQVVLVSY